MKVSQWLIWSMATFLSVLTKKRINNTRYSKGRGGFFLTLYSGPTMASYVFSNYERYEKYCGTNLYTTCLHNLYSIELLTRIGITLEMMFKVHFLTSIHSRWQFTEICIEIGLEKPLVAYIVIKGYKFLLEYEDLHQIGFHCRYYGHKMESSSEFLE